MLFLVSCVYNWGVTERNFRIVEAESRFAVVEAIVASPDVWTTFLRDADLYDPIVRGNMPYYADPKPITAEEAMPLIERSSVDGDSRAQLSILPITEFLEFSASKWRTKPIAEAQTIIEEPVGGLVGS